MRTAVAVTDDRWAAHLRDRPDLVEANFWLPSGMGFRAVVQDEPVLFKTHWSAGNRLVGGGLYSGYARLRVSEAWSLFREGNGVATQAELLARIRHYRRDHRQDDADPDPFIGCVMLRSLFFAVPGTEPPGPPDFGRPIVTWKVYDLDKPSSSYVREAFEAQVGTARIDDDDWAESAAVAGPTTGAPRLTIPRAGQQAFKGLILIAYQRRCAITGGRIQPVLQAAHIKPVHQAGLHRVDNGMLLRSDVHILYDAGYLGVDDKYRLRVSPKLRADFGNGREYYEREGTVIALPPRRPDRPARDAVTWHMDTVFPESVNLFEALSYWF
jgi:putative restriction endonuclease